jgi:hypothetical protein
MIRLCRNIWTLEALGYRIVVPTNIGWAVDGRAVMGRGIAFQANIRAGKVLAGWYGGQCQRYGKDMPILDYERLILFPVKPLNELAPHLSWQSDAELWLIERSTMQLAAFPGTDKIAVPMVGCGYGRRKVEEVLPILKKHLKSTRFVLVEFPNSVAK